MSGTVVPGLCVPLTIEYEFLPISTSGHFDMDAIHSWSSGAVDIVFGMPGLQNSHFKVVILQGDSLSRGPKLLSIKNYVNQLTDDELTTGYYQQ